MDGTIVGVCVDDFVGVTVPAVQGTFFPQLCAVEIWLRDAVEGEGGDFEDELDDEERDDYPWGLPFPWDGFPAVCDAHLWWMLLIAQVGPPRSSDIKDSNLCSAYRCRQPRMSDVDIGDRRRGDDELSQETQAARPATVSYWGKSGVLPVSAFLRRVEQHERQ